MAEITLEMIYDSVMKLNKRLDRLEKSMDTDWVTPDIAVKMTGYSKESLRKFRRSGRLTYQSSNGRKIKYNRKELEAMHISSK